MILITKDSIEEDKFYIQVSFDISAATIGRLLKDGYLRLYYCHLSPEPLITHNGREALMYFRINRSCQY